MSTYPPQYPPFYPTADPPPPPVPEQLTVNGVDLGSYCYMTTDVSGLLSTPAKRGDNARVPGRHGELRTLRKRYDANEIVLPMWVLGARPDGTIPASGEDREFYRRRDALLQIFAADEVTLEFRRPDGVSLASAAEVVDVLDFTRRWAEPMARVSVALRLIDAFWTETADVSQTVTGVNGTTVELTVFSGSTAPVADARVTFYGPVSNPRITIGDRSLQFNGVVAAGRELLLESEHWRATSGAGPLWSPPVTQIYREPGPAWLEIPPTSEPPTLTWSHTGGGSASVEIAGRRKFLTA